MNAAASFPGVSAPIVALPAPTCVVALGIVAALACDLLATPGRRMLSRTLGVGICALGAWVAGTGAGGRFGLLSSDPVGNLAMAASLVVTALLLLVSRHPAEADDDRGFDASVLGIALGACLTAAATDLVTLWLGLESMSLPGYVLAAWRARDRRAAEAGMKYVLFGAVASAVSLFGLSHVYGLVGSLQLPAVGAALATGSSPALLAALCLLAVGLLYKLTAAPFHFYAPDVYQGAPPLSVATVLIVPKIAAIAAVVHLLGALPRGTANPALTALAIASLLVGAFTALVQRDARRIVAFSGVGHAGALLLLAGTGSAPPTGALGLYLLAYAAGNLGALACLHVLERDCGGTGLPDLAGAGTRRPGVVALLALFLLSLLGMPPLAGFLAKWQVLAHALGAGMADGAPTAQILGALVLLGCTPVAAWSYLLVVRAAILQPAPTGTTPAKERVGSGTLVVLGICAAATVGLGLWLDGGDAIAAATR